MKTTRSPWRARRSSFWTTVFCACVQQMLRLIAQKSTMSPIRKSLLGRVFAQEFEQPIRLARPRAEVDVGQE